MAVILVIGALFSAVSQRLARLNNKFLEGSDCNKATTYDVLVDANLYAGILQKFPLSLSDFEIVDSRLAQY